MLGKVMGFVALNRCVAMLCSNKAKCIVVLSSDTLCGIMLGQMH